MAEVDTSINGTPHHLVTDAPTALDAIRNDLGLTGTKLVCGHGACGACVVGLDGVPVASCLLSVEDLEGRSVQTVEGVGQERLHPVQLAFMENDALQCGYCTPGFIVEAVAFHDEWRRTRDQERPERDDIARALAGHLCRCGSYEGIYEAVARACAGEYDQRGAVAPARPDALAKVTGAARYTTDVVLDGMLHGVIVRSIVGSGHVVDIDPEPGLAMDGVRGFVELLPDDRRIRHLGQAVGAIAATDEATAARAAARVVVRYSEMPGVYDMTSALAEGAPNVHGHGWSPPNNNEGRALPNIRRGNRRGPTLFASFRPLKAKRAIASARRENPSRVVAGRWITQAQIHTPFEPHVTVAHWPTPKSLVVHTSTQGITVARHQLARRYRLHAADIEVIADHVGGAFGAKQMLDFDVIAAVELARHVAAPVRVVYDRQEELSYTGYRPGAEVELEVAATAGGSLAGMSVTSYADGGAAGGQLVAALVRYMYRSTPHYLADYDVLTNMPMGKAFRAPGGPVAAWAVEQAIDQLAEQIGTDPITLRERSGPEPLRQAVYTAARSSEMWARRGDPGSGRYRRGVGLAFASWIYVLDGDTEASVAATSDGFRVSASVQDIGNGSRAVLAAAVADVFGVPPDAITVDIGHSGHGHGPLSSGSRTTASLWPAANRAATEVREELIASARDRLGLTGAIAVPGGLRHQGELIPWSDLLGDLGPVSRTSKRPPDRHVPVLKRGVHWAMLKTSVNHGEPGVGHTEGATLVEIEVDTLLGRIRPVAAHAIVAAGKIHAPGPARSQVSGAVIQGLGFAIHEVRRTHPGNGLNLTSNLEDYQVPGIGDCPPIAVEFIELGFDDVPGGGIGMSELATVSVAAAVGNAVADAVGVRMRTLPLRPERVLEALR